MKITIFLSIFWIILCYFDFSFVIILPFMLQHSTNEYEQL